MWRALSRAAVCCCCTRMLHALLQPRGEVGCKDKQAGDETTRHVDI